MCYTAILINPRKLLCFFLLCCSFASDAVVAVWASEFTLVPLADAQANTHEDASKYVSFSIWVSDLFSFLPFLSRKLTSFEYFLEGFVCSTRV